MHFPYLPKNRISLFIADTHIDGATVIRPPEIEKLPDGLKRHADLGICIISSKKAVCPPESCTYYKEKLSHYGYEIIQGKTHIDGNYPSDSAYNVGIVGKRCFLNENVCDKVLYNELLKEGYEIINVKQGYTKCSICPVDENSFITADRGIFTVGEKIGMDVLLISNDKIVLPGYQNGFFGGCCGLSSENELLINGDISTLPDAEKIRKFLEKKNMTVKNLKKGEVIDIGSIIPLMINNSDEST